MKRDLKTLLADLKSARGAQLVLFFGDDLQVAEACRSVVDLLVPPDRRGFNFERFDGRSASWEQIEASLMTPPFLPGKKLVWVESAPYFFSREQKGELGAKILELWRGGKTDEAAKLLGDLLALEGWRQERWERLDTAAANELIQLLEECGAESREEAEALLSHSQTRQLDLNKRKGADEHRLLQLLEEGLPDWSFLLLSAAQVDRRTRLYKRFEESGAAIFLGIERDRYGKVSRESLADFVARRLAQAQKTVEPQARELIVARVGDDLRGVAQELEKLLLFVGDRPEIRAPDVEAIVADRGEGWIFDLTRALEERNGRAALAQLARLLAQGEHPLKILGTIAAEVRRLLAARQLMEGDLAKLWRGGMSYQQFQQTVLQSGAPLLGRNAYADYLCFQRAERFSLSQLLGYMDAIFEADLRLKSSGHQPRLVIEKLILGMCLKSAGGKSARQAAG